MIWVLLIGSLLLVGVYAASYRLRPAASTTFILLFYFATILFGVGSKWLALVYLLIIPLFIAFRFLGYSQIRFVTASAGMVFAVVIISIVAFIPRWREIEALMRDYPLERIDGRLAYESKETLKTHRQIDSENIKNVEEAVTGLSDSLDFSVRRHAQGSWWHRINRKRSLRKLEEVHGGFVQAFISQEGFGLVRRIRIPASDEYIRLPPIEPLALSNVSPPSGSAELQNNGHVIPSTKDVRQWHTASVANFANPAGFGFILDQRGHIASPENKPDGLWVRGFQSHGFQSIPEDSPVGNDWQLARVDLVSLLKHDPPAVYLSDALPRMEELADDDIPTRKLDPFEAQALEQLDDGEVIVVRRSRNRIRMLGAILATRECVQCHFVHQGEMLGAFSYEFWRKEPLPAKNVPDKATPPLL